MPTIGYPTDVGIANYFSHDVQGSILVGIDIFACRRAEESSLNSSSKVLLMFADWLESQCIISLDYEPCSIALVYACISFLPQDVPKFARSKIR